MDQNKIIDYAMSLEEKLRAIDEALKKQEKINTVRKKSGLAPIDPASLTICDGCE